MEEFIIHIRGLIAKDRLEKAIELIIERVGNEVCDFLNDAILISRELYGLKHADIPFTVANRVKNRISLRMLNLLERIYEDLTV